jgi:mRNA interferase RelE/StbE
VYKAILYKDAIKFYKRTDPNLRKRINSAIEVIVQNPHHHIHIKKLQGDLSNMYRYRLGDIRIIYEIHEDIKTIRIKTIEYRGSAYNR